MKEVARDSGISRNSVSKVLNGDPTIKESTRRRVLASCEKLGYVRNLHAVNLVRRENRTIGFVTSRITDPFHNELIEAAEKQATAMGYQLTYQCSYMEASREEEILRHFRSLNVCALIIAPAFANGGDYPYLDRTAEQLPVVYIDKYIRAASHHVVTDHYDSARRVTEHLLAQGAIPAYLGKACTALAPRRAGYEETMRARGHEPIYVPVEGPDPDNDILYGYRNVADYLTAHPAPSGLFCVSDSSAVGAMHALVEHGLKPGENVLVAGHDDLRFSAFVKPTLTTMATPKEAMGRAAVEVAISLLGRTGKRSRYVRRTLKSRLIVRESSRHKLSARSRK